MLDVPSFSLIGFKRIFCGSMPQRVFRAIPGMVEGLCAPKRGLPRIAHRFHRYKQPGFGTEGIGSWDFGGAVAVEG